jgi:hypothetical protein
MKVIELAEETYNWDISECTEFSWNKFLAELIQAGDETQCSVIH